MVSPSSAPVVHGGSRVAAPASVAALSAWIAEGDAAAVDAVGRTMVHHAAKHGDPGVLAAAVRAGGDPMSVDEDGMSPAHVAAAHGHAECVRDAVRMGCPAGAVDDHGWTIAHHAVESGRGRAFRAAVTAGCDPFLVDPAEPRGRSAVVLACERDRAAILVVPGVDPVRVMSVLEDPEQIRRFRGACATRMANPDQEGRDAAIWLSEVRLRGRSDTALSSGGADRVMAACASAGGRPWSMTAMAILAAR